jgi:hypothetical protein
MQYVGFIQIFRIMLNYAKQYNKRNTFKNHQAKAWKRNFIKMPKINVSHPLKNESALYLKQS